MNKLTFEQAYDLYQELLAYGNSCKWRKVPEFIKKEAKYFKVKTNHHIVHRNAWEAIAKAFAKKLKIENERREIFKLIRKYSSAVYRLREHQ